MKKIILVLLVFQIQNLFAQDSFLLKTDKDKFSYSIGYELGKNIYYQKMDLNYEALIKGLQNGLEVKPELMTEDEMMKLMVKIQTEMIERKEKEKEKNKLEGEKFLSENKLKEGVIELPSGLQYKILKQSDGALLKGVKKVRAHYRGYLIDGKEFDSSYKRGKPYDFDVTKIIKGWQEALSLMRVGDKWQLFIPSKLAYGENGSGIIKPNSVLLFDLEIISIVE